MPRSALRRASLIATVALSLATFVAAGVYHRASSDPVYDEPRAPERVSFVQVERARGARLPLADRAGPLPADELPLVTVTVTALLVGTTPVAEVPAGERLAQPWGFRGLDQHKGAELLARPLFLVLDAAAERARAADPDGRRPEGVRLALDPETPYRAAVEVVYSAGQAQASSFRFLVATPTGPGALTHWPPHYVARGRRANPCASSEVFALVTPERLELRSSWPCPLEGEEDRVLPSASIPTQNGRLPRRAIVDAARGLYPSHPDFGVPVVELSALPEAPWQLVVDAFAALEAAGAAGEIDPYGPEGEWPRDKPQVQLAAPRPSVEAWGKALDDRLVLQASNQAAVLRALDRATLQALTGAK